MQGFKHVLRLYYSLLVLIATLTSGTFLTTSSALAADDKNAGKGTKNASSCELFLTKDIPTDWVERMAREGKADDATAQRLREVVQRFGFKATALNQKVVADHSIKYTVELPQGPITDQKSSGRCWIFAGLNMLRSQLIAEGKVPANFEFSETYLHFFNMLEKSNTYLEDIITQTYEPVSEETTTSEKKNKGKKKKKRSARELAANVGTELENFSPEIGDGGWFDYFQFLVQRYGLVPKSAMNETRTSENTGILLEELRHELANGAHAILAAAEAVAQLSEKTGKSVTVEEYLGAIRKIKSVTMRNVWRILATHLGDPPTDFEYRTDAKATQENGAKLVPAQISKYTPQAFAQSFTGFVPSDYVVVTAYPKIPTEKYYAYEDAGIGAARENEPHGDLRFLNVSTERMEALTATAIRGGQAVWFGADVSRDVDGSTGIMHPEVYDRDAIYNIPAKERFKGLDREGLRYFDLISPNHAMLITGLDQPNPNSAVLKYKVENSWGAKVGTNGVYHMYRDWFYQNVFQVVIHKKFLSPEEAKAIGEKPIAIPPNIKVW